MGKISTNTNLKRRIREFQAQHGVSHSIALKAVDEPLHALRDLGRLPELLNTLPQVTTTGTPALQDVRFRLVGDSSRFAELARDHSEHQSSFIKGMIIHGQDMEFTSKASLMRMISNRFELFEKAGVRDIWSFRELLRGGIVGFPEDLENSLDEAFKSSVERRLFEPIFYYYENELDRQIDHYLSLGYGDRLGIFPVSLTSILEQKSNSNRALIPLTLNELEELQQGRFSGDPRFLQRINRKPGRLVERKIYSYLAELNDPIAQTSNSQIRFFFGNPSETPESAEGKLRQLGIDPELFSFTSIRDGQFTVTLEGDQIQFIDRTKRYLLRDLTSSERVLEFDPELAEETYRELVPDRYLSTPLSTEVLQKIKETVSLKDYMEFENIDTTEAEADGRFTAECLFSGEIHRLTADLNRGVFFCFSCGEAGDIVSLVQKRMELSFPDTIGYLRGFEMRDGRLARIAPQAPEL